MLHENIQKVLHRIGIEEFTLPQIKAMPEIISGKHCLIIAPTGLGKTEAALLPIFHLFLNEKKKEGIKILYVTPLRALNRDMLRRTFLWGKELGIKIAVRHGDTTLKERRRQALHPPDMLITTPETLQIMLAGKKLRKNLSTVKWVVVDEIHELAGEERGWQLSIALERLYEIAGDFQRIGLSATVGNPEEVAKFLGGKRKVEIINAMEEKKMQIEVESPELQEIDYEMAEKMEIDGKSAALLRRMKEIIDEHVATLLFVNTRDAAEILAARLRELKASIEVHHGSLSREARVEAEEKFKRGEIKALICTSSLELGIDIGHADLVLQYNSPRQVTRIIQRVGRSGHKVGRISKGKILAINPEEYAEAKVIARRAMKNEIEKIKVRKNPMAVLANQIIAMAIEYGSIEAKKIYEIVKRAYPFHSLSEEKFFDLLKQLHRSGIIWLENGKVKKRRKSTFYFIDNISMIPDEKSYDVVDISSNKVIGKLDESFVSSYCEVGARFIMKGRAWEVAKKNDKIYVSPASKTYIVPDWVGEEIPVPFEVAREVGKLRRLVAEGKVKDRVIEEEIKEQRERGFKVPSDLLLTIEYATDVVYVNTHFGTKVNETLGRILAALIAQRIGESVAVGSDAYRIYFRVPSHFKPELIKDILTNLKPEAVESLLRIILKRTSYIKWEAVKVARKFGILEKDAEYDKFSMERLLNVLSNTPFMEEVIEKTMWERMDVENTKRALEMIRSGKISIEIQPLSPISLEGEKARQEFLKPFGIDASMLEALKRRLEETRIKLKCMNCGNTIETRVYRASEKCNKCGSKMLAVIKKEFGKDRGWLMKNASLVASYGKKAIFVLAGYGIGPDTASRILGKQKDGKELLKEILKAEITYARTRRFWDME
ncbi:MAG: DEAD/DEAH box helicase [Thermoplasmata archaeon]|nr:DEAD/DEAH box helicase [Thermoplasmata archaeon]